MIIKSSRLFLSLFSIYVLFRLLLWFAVSPQHDETYYWLWGQHPGFSYYDHPPLLAWTQGLFSTLFGTSRLVLRLPNLITTTIFFYTYYCLMRHLYGSRTPQYFCLLVLLVLASPLYFMFLFLAWPDHLMVTCSLVSAYLLITFMDGYGMGSKGQSWRLFGAAAALGLALLSKYTAVFVGIAFLGAIVSSKRSRTLLLDPRFYISALIVLSGLIPIILWNISHNFQSFYFYWTRTASGTLLWRFPTCRDFLIFAAVTVSPFLCIGFFQSTRQPNPWIRKNTAFPLVAWWLFGFSTGFLTLLALVTPTHVLYYWNILAYLLLFPLLPPLFLSPVSFDTTTSSLALPWNRLTKKPLFIATQGFGLLCIALILFNCSIFPLSALGSKDGDPDSRMLFGWSEVGRVVESQAAELGNTALITTTHYTSASKLALQLHNPDIFVISERISQFDFWYDNEQEFKARTAVILADDWHPITPELLAQFDHTSAPVTVSIERFGRWIKNYYVLKGYQFSGKTSESIFKERRR